MRLKTANVIHNSMRFILPASHSTEYANIQFMLGPRPAYSHSDNQFSRSSSL